MDRRGRAWHDSSSASRAKTSLVSFLVVATARAILLCGQRVTPASPAWGPWGAAARLRPRRSARRGRPPQARCAGTGRGSRGIRCAAAAAAALEGRGRQEEFASRRGRGSGREGAGAEVPARGGRTCRARRAARRAARRDGDQDPANPAGAAEEHHVRPDAEGAHGGAARPQHVSSRARARGRDNAMPR